MFLTFSLAAPKSKPQLAPSLADHPQATMSSITLNVSAVKVKYMTHMDELKILEKNYRSNNEIHETGKPKRSIHIKPKSQLLVPNNKPKNETEQENYERLICLIPNSLHVYIMQ